MTVTWATSSAVTVAGLPSTVESTDTAAEEPSTGSLTVHTVPTGKSSIVVEVSPAGALAAMSMSCSSPLSHDTCTVTAPCSPAADPAIVLVTSSEDNTAW